ncbi:unnamed protein product [Diatraea saccharalis]|uniref:Hemicentin/VWA7 galactose-binding domain-containing protein n=1 Tax=Diatraea saccharalis TaxID=40085 RepID=A0A9N9N4L9_9NEOP|nr:unnamed protein product [Diatraea saccharalis]
MVRTSIRGRNVNLGSSVLPAGYNHTQEIPVDSTVGEVTVSVSGSKPQIKVVDPKGEELTGPPKLITTLDLSEIMVSGIRFYLLYKCSIFYSDWTRIHTWLIKS